MVASAGKPTGPITCCSGVSHRHMVLRFGTDAVILADGRGRQGLCKIEAEGMVVSEQALKGRTDASFLSNGQSHCHSQKEQMAGTT